MDIPLPHSSVTRSRRGVTLIELMIVVVLIGILAAVAIQQVAGTSDPYAAVDEARKIHAAMVSARARAIATQRQHRFVLEPGGVWRIQEENPPGTWTATADSGTAAAIVTMDASSSGTVVYYARGRVDAPKTIQVTVHGHTQAFDILASGLVRW